jgi:hypothetical protein
MFWWDEPEAPDTRHHMKFIGWVHNENFSISRRKQGLTRSTTLHCVDVAGRLELLPGFSQVLSRIDDESLWSYMPELNINKFFYYLMYWHSTAINVADFFLAPGGGDYVAVRLDANGSNLLDQVASLANKMVPDHILVTNTQGQMSIVRDWRLDDVADRPTVVSTITEDEWNDLQVDYNRTPKVHVLHSAAVLATEELVTIEGYDEPSIPLVFSVAPSDTQAFGQGVAEVTENEGLALSQEALNIAEGHRFALLNARYGPFRFSDPTGYDFWEYEPASMKRVQFNISAAKAAQRGLDFTDAKGMVNDIAVNYSRTKKGLSIKATVSWDKEIEGFPATTFIPEGEGSPPIYVPPEVPLVPPDYGFVDDQELVAMISAQRRVYTTSNFLNATPTWETSSQLGDNVSWHNWVVDPFSPGYIETAELDPSEPMPLLAIFNETSGVLLDTSENGEIKHTMMITSSVGEGLVEADNIWIAVVPPENTVRVVLECQWLNYYSTNNPVFSSKSTSYALHQSALSPEETSDLSFSQAAANASTSQRYTVEWERGGGQTEWFGNREDFEASPPTSAADFCHVRMDANVTTSGSTTATNILFHKWRVVEVELENGHIYNPPAPAAINGWVVTDTQILRLEDLFAVTPTVVVQHTFATALPSSGRKGGRNIAASFGRFFESDSDNPWLVVGSYYGEDVSGKAGLWVTHSEDAGATWSTEVQITGWRANESQNYPLYPAIYTSPRTPGMAFIGVYTSSNAATGYGYKSTDWGENWVQIDEPDLDIGASMGVNFHVPFPDNEDELLAYYSRSTVTAGPVRTASLHRVQGASDTDITPTLGGDDYGLPDITSQPPMDNHFSIRTFDSDRSYTSFVGTSYQNAAYGAWFVSEDGGDTWTNRFAGATPFNPVPSGAAFSGHDRNILYIWGYKYMSYTSDFGATIQDKRGNVSASMVSSSVRILGIAGGPPP